MDFNIKSGQRVSIQYDRSETPAVQIAVDNLKKDLEMVFDKIKVEVGEQIEDVDASICIHTDPQGLACEDFLNEFGNVRREAYQIRIENGTMFITGTDCRGTVYGIYTLSEMLGVSPWYFFADVPIRKRLSFSLEDGFYKTDWPSVEYRGIFINDEEELETWVQNYMNDSTIGVKSYEKIFELLLRLKANYIWPAMHVNSFNMTPENGALAERMGIVVGTSHCDMLMRSNNREWIPWIEKKGYTDAVYDYSVAGRNREILKEYWKESIEQNQDYEVCYTLGMRGIHDSGFETRGLEGQSQKEITAAKVQLLDKIITDQRKLLSDTLDRKPLMTFIPYKEVLELYDNGLEIPEDVTLIWANDNYGYIRRYPSDAERQRSGGNGIYYHNSYWAPPSMSYVFLCSIPLAHTRYELQKAWDEGIRKLWVLNCGAMKPLEQEITFFLKLAWEIGKEEAVTKDVNCFVAQWINQMFSGNLGKRVSVLLNDFSQLTNVRKVENMDYDAFSQVAYGDEAAMRIARYQKMFHEGNRLYEQLPENERDAFFQLVLMRIHAAYFTNLAYYYGDRSTLMYVRGNMQAADDYVKRSREAEDARRRMIYFYNHVMSRGKWNGILDPEGFPPPRAAMMPVCTPALDVGGTARMRVNLWNEDDKLSFVNNPEKWVDIGNQGIGEIHVQITAPDWVTLSETELSIQTEARVLVSCKPIDAIQQGTLIVRSQDDGKTVEIPIECKPAKAVIDGYAMEEDGIISLESTDAIELRKEEVTDFEMVDHLGRMQGRLVGSKKNMHKKPLTYLFETENNGIFSLELHRFPSLNSVGRIRVGIAVDDREIQLLETLSTDEWRADWRTNVLNNVDRMILELPFLKKGRHRLLIYAIDPYVAFSRIVIYTKPRKDNNLAGITGTQPLPEHLESGMWCDKFYGKCRLLPRPSYTAIREREGDSLQASVIVRQQKAYAKQIAWNAYLSQAQSPFMEQCGAIKIDVASVLAQNENAWKDENENARWRHCSSESYGRSGIAMYIRHMKSDLNGTSIPALHYRFLCAGGVYTIWLLSKFDVIEQAGYCMGIDGAAFSNEQMYNKGSLWRYEAEQIYRWVPAATCPLAEGIHVLDLYGVADGMRYDRIYIAKGQELPPMDTEW